MPESDLKIHEEKCPDKILIDLYVHGTEDKPRPNSNVEIVPSIKYNESWDGLKQTSDIMEVVKTKTASMKAINGITMSKRKQNSVNLHENQINNEKSAYCE